MICEWFGKLQIILEEKKNFDLGLILQIKSYLGNVWGFNLWKCYVLEAFYLNCIIPTEKQNEVTYWWFCSSEMEEQNAGPGTEDL